MTNLQKLQKKLPQFTWVQEDGINGSIFGSITVPQLEKRISQDLYKLENIYVFISGKMTPSTHKPFRYATCYQKAEIRPYRCKNTFEAEFNKLYVSSEDLQGIVNKLIKQVDMSKYYLTKKDLVESK